MSNTHRAIRIKSGPNAGKFFLGFRWLSGKVIDLSGHQMAFFAHDEPSGLTESLNDVIAMGFDAEVVEITINPSV